MKVWGILAGKLLAWQQKLKFNQLANGPHTFMQIELVNTFHIKYF